MIKYYNPFKDTNGNSIDFEKIKYEDLTVLSQIKEDYSIEYKSDFSNSVKEIKLPKAISAFANRSGGWFFIGVNDNGTLNDVDISNISEEMIYSIVQSRVSPIPTFDVKIIQNPVNDQLGVIVIYVYKGTNTPYISNGTVFVRNGKSSDPADRSSLDLLIKQSMDYSNIKLCCIDCDDGLFKIDEDRLEIMRNDPKYFSNRKFGKFYDLFQDSKSISLFIENNGKHFDENIEMTIKLSRDNYYNVQKTFLSYPDSDFDEMASDLFTPYKKSDITEFIGENLFFQQPPMSQFMSQEEYNKSYAEYLSAREYPYEIIKENNEFYLKMKFKNLNPGQKMFLPSVLMVCRNIQTIDYFITSKYSMGKIYGTLKIAND